MPTDRADVLRVGTLRFRREPDSWWWLGSDSSWWSWPQIAAHAGQHGHVPRPVFATPDNWYGEL